jgi:hypothetical protein
MFWLVRSLGVRIFGLRCLGVRNFGFTVFWLAACRLAACRLAACRLDLHVVWHGWPSCMSPEGLHVAWLQSVA